MQYILVVVIRLVYEFKINLESPEWVARVRASIKEANGLGAGAQQVLCGQALSLRNVTDLETEENDNLS